MMYVVSYNFTVYLEVSKLFVRGRPLFCAIFLMDLGGLVA